MVISLLVNSTIIDARRIYYSICQKKKLGKGRQFFTVLFLWRASHQEIIFYQIIYTGEKAIFNLNFEFIALRMGYWALNEIPNPFLIFRPIAGIY